MWPGSKLYVWEMKPILKSEKQELTEQLSEAGSIGKPTVNDPSEMLILQQI